MLASNSDRNPWTPGLVAAVVLGGALAAWWIALLWVQETSGDPTFFQQFWGGFNVSLGFHPLPGARDASGNFLFLWANFPSNMAQVTACHLTGASAARQVTLVRGLAAAGAGIGVPFLFLLARRRGLGEGSAFALTAAFALNPFLLSGIHELVIGYGLAVAAAMFWAAETGRRRTFLVLAAVHCGTHPTAFLMVGAYAYFVLGRDGDEGRLRRQALWLCAAWVAWLAAANGVLLATGRGMAVLQSHLGLLAGLWAWAQGQMPGGVLLESAGVLLGQAALLLASTAFLPLGAGRWLWVLVPDAAYMLLREGSVFRGTFAAVVAVLFVASAQALARLGDRPRVARAWAAAAVAASVAVSVGVGDAHALWIGRPVLATFGLPGVTTVPNATLLQLRDEAAGPGAPACVTAEMDVAPSLMGLGPDVRVFGVDSLDPACDRVVLRTDPPHRVFAAERVGGMAGERMPADYDAARRDLEASGRFRRALDADGLTIWVPM